jgi:hypothetical protein
VCLLFAFDTRADGRDRHGVVPHMLAASPNAEIAAALKRWADGQDTDLRAQRGAPRSRAGEWTLTVRCTYMNGTSGHLPGHRIKQYGAGEL